LIEILVVVAILALLASMGMVQLLRARMVTREHIAISNMRHIAKACHWYFSAGQEYPSNLAALGPGVVEPPYIDASLAADPATKQGYTFVYEPQPPGGPYVTFALHAQPEIYLVTGERSFYTDQDLIAYGTTEDRQATTGDPIVP